MSRGPGRIEQAIGHVFAREPRRNAGLVWVGVDAVAAFAYQTKNPTHAQRVTIRRSMHTFVRKYEGFQLDGGWGRTPLFVVGWADKEPNPRKHPLARAPRITAELSMVSKWRRRQQRILASW